MKLSCLRPLAALLLTLGLAACGGKATYDVSGTITGLNNNGLVLTNNGDTVTPGAGATNFTFAKRIDYGTSYDITIAQQPKGAVCTIANGSGKASSYSVTTAVVSCQTNTYALSGTITGLSADGLTLVIGSNGTSPLKGSTAYTFPAIADGTPYNISIRTQPTGQTCRFQGSTSADGHDTVGTMGSAATTAATLDCTAP